jgi:regulator of protease activity HflC (stomatin/prohibitin superfamily)
LFSFLNDKQNVSFEAEQVTKEVQGVRVKGFATWTVYREDDGPFRAYRTFDGLSDAGRKMANNQLGSLVESILRNMVSNLTINEVLTQRDSLRKNAREQLTEITKGWGIWIETVEITDVRISSSSLFSNLQAEFRQKTRLEAEQIQMKTDKELSDARRTNDVATQEGREKAETTKYQIQQQQMLNREQRKFQTTQEQHKIKLQTMEQNKEYSFSSRNRQ